jgi:hypothetical protein
MMGRLVDAAHIVAGIILGSVLILALVVILAPEAREPIVKLIFNVGDFR